MQEMSVCVVLLTERTACFKTGEPRHAELYIQWARFEGFGPTTLPEAPQSSSHFLAGAKFPRCPAGGWWRGTSGSEKHPGCCQPLHQVSQDQIYLCSYYEPELFPQETVSELDCSIYLHNQRPDWTRCAGCSGSGLCWSWSATKQPWPSPARCLSSQTRSDL